MDDELREMLEHYRITRLVAEYCHGCDRMDEVRMASVYAEDSWDDHGLNKMPGQDYSRQAMASRVGIDDLIHHHLGQTLVKVDGDSAGAETYFIATIARPEAGETVPKYHHMGGRYVDHLVREGGQWRIRKRITIRDWSETVTVTEDWVGQRQFVAGRKDNDDPSFAALGIRHSGIPAAG